MVSVEANPSLIKVLKRNVEANGPRDRIAVIHAAIAYTIPPVDFVEMNFGDLSLAGWVSDSVEQRLEFKVQCLTLRELTSRYEIDRFALITDIEGAEAGIFVNEKETLGHCPLMIVELHETTFEGRHLSIPDLIAIVTELGYTLKDSHRDVYVFENLAFASKLNTTQPPG